jgi:methylenetetrahydrofolate dehydrogenase (NADP+)/methenyltetrahydrofolate cyclohydrolase
MTAEILNGKVIAGEIRSEVAVDVRRLTEQGHRVPGLGVVLVGDDPASAVYVRNKETACAEAGLHSETLRLPADAGERAVLDAVHDYNRRPDIDGILVQLPLPADVDADRVIGAIDPGKDVDGFHPVNVGNLCLRREGFVPCTPAGIMELLRRSGIEPAGRRAVVIGRSAIVGRPMALLLQHANATVTVCHSRTRDLPAVAAEADLLIAAIGRPAMVTADYIKPGAVVIDVGMNRIEDPVLARDCFGHKPKRLAAFERKGHTLIGDVHPRHAREKAGAWTPVPGGVGPLTIAMLLRNTLWGMQRRAGRG